MNGLFANKHFISIEKKADLAAHSRYVSLCRARALRTVLLTAFPKACICRTRERIAMRDFSSGRRIC
jgi:hypothetical protein